MSLAEPQRTAAHGRVISLDSRRGRPAPEGPAPRPHPQSRRDGPEAVPAAQHLPGAGPLGRPSLLLRFALGFLVWAFAIYGVWTALS